MQIRISDMMDECCPAQVELGDGDAMLAARVQSRVFEKIGAARPRRRSKAARILPLAAVLALLLGTVAFAASEFFMNVERRDAAEPPVEGRWLMVGEDGQVLTDVKEIAPNAGMVLGFSGPEERWNMPEFRCFYLPSAAEQGLTDEEGWTRYLADEHGDTETEIPYIIEARNVEPGVSRFVIDGAAELVKEERWGDWQVMEVHSDYRNVYPRGYDEANYILLFDAARGYLVQVKGTLDMETLEHIARELEIRQSAEPFAPSGYTEMLSSLNVARG